jgi:hypothetical protein
MLISLLHTLHELRYHYASMGVSPSVRKVLLRLALQVRGAEGWPGGRQCWLGLHRHMYVDTHHCADTRLGCLYPIYSLAVDTKLSLYTQNRRFVLVG